RCEDEVNRRFSIVIPAHNEERYLARTLEHLAKLAYPSQLYEVVVVENGSSDQTFEIAKRFESGNVQVLRSAQPGVSAAKNLGIDRLSPSSDWVVFLDADTVLTPSFLVDLDARLGANSKPLAVGTARVLPMGGSRRARAWF